MRDQQAVRTGDPLFDIDASDYEIALTKARAQLELAHQANSQEGAGVASAEAVLAQRHSIPFIVAAPTSTIDRDTATGADIPLEERDPSEVTPHGHPAANYAFDITPAELVTALVTERGVTHPEGCHPSRRGCSADA